MRPRPVKIHPSATLLTKRFGKLRVFMVGSVIVVVHSGTSSGWLSAAVLPP